MTATLLEIAVGSLLSAWAPGPGELPELQPPGTEETCAGEPSLEFVEPVDGAMLDSPITVSYIARGACNCDTGGCYDGDLDNVQLSANGQVYGLSGAPIEVQLPAGEHTLTLSGSADFHEETASISVTILQGSESSGGSEGEENSDSSASKCAVVDPSERAVSTFGLVLLLGLGARRSRRCR